MKKIIAILFVFFSFFTSVTGQKIPCGIPQQPNIPVFTPATLPQLYADGIPVSAVGYIKSFPTYTRELVVSIYQVGRNGQIFESHTTVLIPYGKLISDWNGFFWDEEVAKGNTDGKTSRYLVPKPIPMTITSFQNGAQTVHFGSPEAVPIR